MTRCAVVLHRFHSVLPPHRADQQTSIDWLAAAHAHDLNPESTAQPEQLQQLQQLQKMRKMISRFGCGPDRIRSRYSVLSDFMHTRWDESRIFNLNAHPSGQGTRERALVFHEAVDEVFKAFYAEETSPPQRLIHVTCTGYHSPSGAQRLVAQRNWGATTEVTHAYHMGCYAALPAVRIAESYLRSTDGVQRVDLVHTELCSLHMNPSLRTPEQLVVQSLFADGLIRYEAQPLESWSQQKAPRVEDCHGLEVLALREEIVPNTGEAMTWMIGDHGFQMTLSRDVPDLISGILESYLERLFSQVGLTFSEQKHVAYFAVHPGGPKIIDRVQECLGLTQSQTQASHDVLLNHGNMSSATLPHIWQCILKDDSIPAGTQVVAMGFGPGLTISGGLFRKVSRV